MFYQSWYSSINNSPRLDTYCLFKHSFGIESYFNYIFEPKYRIALTKFRTSSHDLNIETGRHCNLPRNARICRNCKSGLPENEYHFVLICSKYADLRSRYIKRYYYTWPTKQKFTNLMCSTSKIILTNLARYIYFANTLRNKQ